jgi:ribosomal protein S18 acetylase RimI-like enzyme
LRLVGQAQREQLDNVVWHALRGPQQTLAEGAGSALRYPSSVAPFAAVTDDASDAAWSALADLVGAGNLAVLFRDRVEPPDTWREHGRIPTYQMLASEVVGEEFADATPLGESDVDAMVDLVERTQPGPFARRTVALGSYFGVRDGDRLVAMAGERICTDRYTEISAICTDPEYRGRGLAAALTLHLVAHIRVRGSEPFLHVAIENENAHRLYLALGFVKRRDVVASILQAP